MSEVAFQRNVLEKLDFVVGKIAEIDKEFHLFKEEMIDSRLSTEEKELAKRTISKIKTGDTSDFISLKQAKKELGL